MRETVSLFYTGAQAGVKIGGIFLLTFVAIILFGGFALLPVFVLTAVGPVGAWVHLAVMIGNVVWFAVVVLPVFSGVVGVVRKRSDDRRGDHYPEGVR